MLFQAAANPSAVHDVTERAELAAPGGRAVLGRLVEGQLAVEHVVVGRATAASDNGGLGVRGVCVVGGLGVGGGRRGNRVGPRGRRVVNHGLGDVRGADAVARVGEQRTEQEGDEDAPIDADRGLDQPLVAAVGLVELAVEDQPASPTARRP